jgi:hypothetical protein
VYCPYRAVREVVGPEARVELTLPLQILYSSEQIYDVQYIYIIPPTMYASFIAHATTKMPPRQGLTGLNFHPYTEKEQLVHLVPTFIQS